MNIRKYSIYILLFVVLIAMSGCRRTPRISFKTIWAGVNNGDFFDEPVPTRNSMLASLDKSNLRVVRIWIDWRFEMDDDGNAIAVGEGYNEGMLDIIDDFMEECRRRGILLIITLHHHNWLISGSEHTYTIAPGSYDWRRCKTPRNVYDYMVETGEPQVVEVPYSQRGWIGREYLTNPQARQAYKSRVEYILNHVNRHSGQRWKDINDVILAWELQNEPEYFINNAVSEEAREVLVDWLSEMAAHVKNIDPDTYVSLGTLRYMDDLLRIEDADIITVHFYESNPAIHPSDDSFVDELIEIRETLHEQAKMLLAEEFTLDSSPAGGYSAERTMEKCRKASVPWMFWEYGYSFDSDDLWHGNDPDDPDNYDGVFWGAKLLPAASKTYFSISMGANWTVNEKVEALFSGRDAECLGEESKGSYKNFSIDPPDPAGYTWIDEGLEDSFLVENGYLTINAGLGQDFWCEGGRAVRRDAPMFLYLAPEEEKYEIETFVKCGLLNVPSQPINTQAGLFVFDDINNWIFFGLNKSNYSEAKGSVVSEDGLIVIVTRDGVSRVEATEASRDKDYAFLRIRKTGNIWRFYAEYTYARTWDLLASVEFDISADRHKVGMGVRTFRIPTSGGLFALGGPISADFDYFKVKRSGIPDSE